MLRSFLLAGIGFARTYLDVRILFHVIDSGVRAGLRRCKRRATVRPLNVHSPRLQNRYDTH